MLIDVKIIRQACSLTGGALPAGQTCVLPAEVCG